MADMALKPWREIAEPNSDVREGKFQEAEFAASLSEVHEGKAKEGYQNPVLFFQRTFITEGMRLLLDSVIRRLNGRGGDPVIQLQTAFGGGKTHTLLAIYHLAKGKVPTSQLQGVPPILDKAGVMEIPPSEIAVLDCVNLFGLASKPQRHESCLVHTLWGEMAWQLGGKAGYEMVRAADESGIAPGKRELTELLSSCSPCVILMDELVRYVSQFEEGAKTRLSGGTYDTQISFIQALTEAVSGVSKAILLVSLPSSEREAGSEQGIRALRTLEHFFRRIQKLWKPVVAEEAFEIVRRRLFSEIADQSAKDAVCQAFSRYYRYGDNKRFFPQDTQSTSYLERLRQGYPIHPEVFDRLYEDWSTLENFQRTRGVLRLMAKVIHRLWKDGNSDLMIMPGSLPLMDVDVRNETISYLPLGWDPVIERDVDSERSQTWVIERENPRLGEVQACRRVARTIFLGSAPSNATQRVRGIDKAHILLGVAQPGQSTGLFDDALRRCSDRLHYLMESKDRFWLGIQANLRREMEERKKRFDEVTDILPMIRDQLRRGLAAVKMPVHIFAPDDDIKDSPELSIVVLPLSSAYDRHSANQATDAAQKILNQCGQKPRHCQNRLIFMAADSRNVKRLKDYTKTVMAWNSIESDYKENRLVLDNLVARQMKDSKEKADEVFKRAVRETFRWLLVPVQEAEKGSSSEMKWENASLDMGKSWADAIHDTLKNNEWVIEQWAPTHLYKELKKWFWKEGSDDVSALHVWQQFCQYPFLPRLKDDHVFQNTIMQGVQSQDFFGTAQGKENDRYLGFVFGRQASITLDKSLLLIEPERARKEIKPPIPPVDPPPLPPEPKPDDDHGQKPPEPPKPPKPVKVRKRFYGTIDLNPIRPKDQFMEVAEEVIRQFVGNPDVKVSVSVEVQAKVDSGFDDTLQRTVRENCHTLGFKQAEFEEE